jgi:hypothetical protein
MDMDQVGLETYHLSPRRANHPGIPGDSQRTTECSQPAFSADLVTVAGKLHHFVTMLTEQAPLRLIDRVLATGGGGAIEVVDKEDFHIS